MALILFLVAAALFWGATNPFINRAGRVPTNFAASRFTLLRQIPQRLPNSIVQHLAKLVNLNFLIPWAINMIGSVFFLYSLTTENPAVASVVANALTLAVSTAVGYLAFGEGVDGNRPLMLAGCALIAVGSALCVIYAP